MSSKETDISFQIAFSSRFAEVCGSTQPSRIAQLLNISYQAAKNYLDGRLPEAKVLKTIAEKTPYSLNWLLTGEGEKFAKKSPIKDTLLATDQMRTFVRQICLEVFAEMTGPSALPPQPKIVTLTSDKIKEETLIAASEIVSEDHGK
jgi:hypothetical protein